MQTSNPSSEMGSTAHGFPRKPISVRRTFRLATRRTKRDCDRPRRDSHRRSTRLWLSSSSTSTSCARSSESAAILRPSLSGWTGSRATTSLRTTSIRCTPSSRSQPRGTTRGSTIALEVSIMSRSSLKHPRMMRTWKIDGKTSFPMIERSDSQMICLDPTPSDSKRSMPRSKAEVSMPKYDRKNRRARRVALITVPLAVLGCDPEGGDRTSEARLVEARFDTLEEEAQDSDFETNHQVSAESDSAPAAPSRHDGAVHFTAEDDPQAGSAAPSCEGLPALGAFGFCEWAKETESGAATVRAVCEDVLAGSRVVSGGCWTGTTASLRVSAPDEGSQGNLPEEGDPWNASTGEAWSCEYSAAPTGGQTHRAVALCCQIGWAAMCS